jgi:hypothetical protein
MNETPEPDKERRGHTVDRRRGTLEALEEHVDEHVDKIERRLSKWLKRGLIAFGLIALACTVSLVGFGIVLDQIQETRKEFVRTACEAQNKRNKEILAKFRKESNEAIKRNPEFADEIRAGRKGNEDIINAIAPRQDCDKLSEVAVGEAEPPPPVPTTTTESRRNP